MPLLSSTQTQSANGAPLYLPLDGNGNVPETVSIVENNGTDVVRLGAVNPSVTGMLLSDGSGNGGATFVGLSGGNILLGAGDLVPSPGTFVAGVLTAASIAPSSYQKSDVTGANPGYSFVVGGWRFVFGQATTNGNGQFSIPQATPFSGNTVCAVAMVSNGTYNGVAKALNDFNTNTGLVFQSIDPTDNTNSGAGIPYAALVIGPA
jgi:hypothetical protein